MRKNLKQNLHFKIQSSIFGSLKQIVNVYKKYVMKSKFKRKNISFYKLYFIQASRSLSLEYIGFAASLKSLKANVKIYQCAYLTNLKMSFVHNNYRSIVINVHLILILKKIKRKIFLLSR